MKEKLNQFMSEYADQPSTSVSLELPGEFLERIKEIAALEGVEFQTVLQYFIFQGLQSSRSEVKRLKFEENAKKILEKHSVEQNVIDEISNMFLH